ncbi:MAG: hypothetical protein ACPGXL_10810, partial [Chitinophagales bacterium]
NQANANAGPDQTICQGETATLVASGGGNYAWSNLLTGASINVSPIATTTYTVTVTDGNGCTDTDQVTVFVGSLNVPNIPNQTICLGESATLVASGGGNYAWNNAQTSASITVSPNSTTTYTVTVTDNNGCTDVESATVTVSQANANAGPNQAICLGESTTLTATGGGNYA